MAGDRTAADDDSVRALLVVVCLVRVASAEPTWTRMLPNSDGSSSFVARDGDQVLLLARTTTCSAWGTVIDGAADLKPESQLPDTQLETSENLCYRLTPEYAGIDIWRLRPSSGQAAAIRALARVVLADAPDSAPRLPGTWEHSRDEAARMVDGHMHAWLDTTSGSPACPPDACTRGSEPVRRDTRGGLVLDVPVASEADPSQRALVAWFDALPDATSLARPVATPLAPAAAAAALQAAATVPADSAGASTTAIVDSPPRHSEPFNVASMLPKGHELLFNDNWLQPAVGIVYADDRANGVAFVPVNAFGGTIIEHGAGFIGKINAAILAGAGGYVGTETRAGVRYDVYNTTMTSGPGPEASWSFNISDQFMGFRADSWWTDHVGWRLGLWSMRELNTDPGANQMPGPTLDMINRYGALYLYNGGGFEVEILMRKDFLLAPLGRFRASIDLPVTYCIAAPFMAAGVLGEDRALAYAYGGVPRLSGDFERRIGPVMMHVIGSVPTGWLVIPLQRGGQLTVAAGLTF